MHWSCTTLLTLSLGAKSPSGWKSSRCICRKTRQLSSPEINATFPTVKFLSTRQRGRYLIHTHMNPIGMRWAWEASILGRAPKPEPVWTKYSACCPRESSNTRAPRRRTSLKRGRTCAEPSTSAEDYLTSTPMPTSPIAMEVVEWDWLEWLWQQTMIKKRRKVVVAASEMAS